MSKLIEVFETTTGKTIKKVQAKDGSIKRFADGKPIKPSSYGAYKSHTPSAEVFQRGNLEDVNTVDQLGFPFTQTTFKNVGQFEPGSEERVRQARVNQWTGFLADDNTPDDPFEAAEEYEKMVSELTGVESQDKRQEIKERYNIGGS